MPEEKDMFKNINERRKSYTEHDGITDKYLIAHVKNLLFSCCDKTVMAKLSESQKHQLDVDTFHFIVTEVLCLTPEQLDSIWSARALVKMNLSSVAKDIFDNASDELKEATLFNKKLIVLHECFPDYYWCRYPERYNVEDVICAKGTVLKDLSKAGRVNAEKVGMKMSGKRADTKDNTGSSGEIVDRIAYHALNVYLKSYLATPNIEEHLYVLARPNAHRIKSLGVSKIIAARGCWASLLDFYYLNSSQAAQTLFFHVYRSLRAETQEYDAITAYLNEVAAYLDR